MKYNPDSLSIPKSNLYDTDVSIIKRIGKSYQIVYLKTIRKKGYDPIYENVKDKTKKINSSDKLSNSLSRTKKNIKELAMANEWEYFFTGTFSPDKVDSRFNRKELQLSVSKFIHKYNEKYSKGFHVKYLIIFEQHKDGSWHFHGLINGICPDHLFINQNGYLDWRQYSKKFGYCSLSKIKNSEAISNYITKYITKDSGKNVDKNDHCYIASKGLKKAEVIAKDHFDVSDINWDYIHPDGYCKIKNYKNDSFLTSLCLL